MVCAACARPRRWRGPAADVVAFAAAGALLGPAVLGLLDPADPRLLGLLVPAVVVLLAPAGIVPRRPALRSTAVRSTVVTLGAIAVLLALGAIALGSWPGPVVAPPAFIAARILPPPGPRPVRWPELVAPIPVPVAALLGGAALPMLALASGHAGPGAAASCLVLGATLWLARGPVVARQDVTPAARGLSY